jgi:alpha-D-xyloside xylohydrolase
MWFSVAGAAANSVLLTAHCDNSVRIRISPTEVQKNLVGALEESCSSSPRKPSSNSSLENGNLRVDVTGGQIKVTRLSDGESLLTGAVPIFTGNASCGATFHGFSSNFATSNTPTSNMWYGLGQLESQNQTYCTDDSPSSEVCGSPLNRQDMGVVPISSVKYHVSIPWLYNRAQGGGWGVFLNQPGDGSVDLRSGLGFSFTCQKQMDIWVTVAPAKSQNLAGDVYEQWSAAIGPPSQLPDKASLYWQSKCQYKDQAEILELASNFSSRNLSVGVIVIDLGLPADPPYYRLDPGEWVSW